MQRSRMHILDSFDHIYRATRFDFHTGTTYARQCFIRPTRTGIRTGIVGSYSGVRGSVRQQTKKVYLCKYGYINGNGIFGVGFHSIVGYA
jgi:hypothetical protein